MRAFPFPPAQQWIALSCRGETATSKKMQRKGKVLFANLGEPVDARSSDRLLQGHGTQKPREQGGALVRAHFLVHMLQMIFHCLLTDAQALGNFLV